MGRAEGWLIFLLIATLAMGPAVAEGTGPGDWGPPSVKLNAQAEDAETEDLVRSMKYLDAHRCDPDVSKPSTVETILESIACRAQHVEDKPDN